MKLLKTLAALALAAAITALAAQGTEDLDTAPAMAAAQAWLNHVDGGNYGQSWDDSAAYFQEKIAKVAWQTKLDKARGPLGGMITRKLRMATYTHTLPGAPEGEYVVIQFDTSFENFPQAIETVTPMREKDGSWKVAGYLIKPAQ
jgi:opacity protein-like surface antigen